MKTGNIDISNLTSSDWLQIEMASKGCVSGTLEEWPRLRKILNDLGLDSRGDMRSGDVQDICRNIVNKSQ